MFSNPVKYRSAGEMVQRVVVATVGYVSMAVPRFSYAQFSQGVKHHDK